MPTLDPAKPSSRRLTAATAVRRGDAGRPQGIGAAAITVKGAAASARQREVLGGVLTEAHGLGAVERVLVACVMCVTQESVAGEATGMTGNDDVGLYQQGRNWISAAGAAQPGPSTRAFLLGSDSGLGGTAPGWKQIHGSVKIAPDDLDAAITSVQVSIGGYRPWQAEAVTTVKAFLGGSLGGDFASAGAAGTTTVEKAVPYLFERGTRKGDPENSWDATGRLAEDVRFRRWAALNTLHFISDDELCAGEASLVMHGDEGWLVTRPTLTLGRPGLTATEVTFQVLSDRWGILPGAVVELRDQGALDGRFLVSSVRDPLYSPVSEIVLRRPVSHAAEPARETRTTTVTTDGTTATTATVSTGGKITAAQLEGLTPKDIIDRIVLPVAVRNGISRTVAQNDAANAVHGPTSSGATSDHQGPPAEAWAADMSNGSAPTPEMAALAAELAEMFGFPHNGNSYVRVSVGGFSFQLLYLVDALHQNHCHFGVQA